MTEYRVIWAPRATRDLNRLPEKVATAIVEFVYGSLAANPHRVGRPMSLVLAGRHSARRGAYRIVYWIDDTEVKVEVIQVGHRSNIYRT